MTQELLDINCDLWTVRDCEDGDECVVLEHHITRTTPTDGEPLEPESIHIPRRMCKPLATMLMQQVD